MGLARGMLVATAFGCLTAGAALALPLRNGCAGSIPFGDADAADDQDINVLFQDPAGLAGLSGQELTANYGRFNPGSLSAITEIHSAYGKPMEFKRVPLRLGALGVAGGFRSQSIGPGVHIF